MQKSSQKGEKASYHFLNIFNWTSLSKLSTGSYNIKNCFTLGFGGKEKFSFLEKSEMSMYETINTIRSAKEEFFLHNQKSMLRKTNI